MGGHRPLMAFIFYNMEEIKKIRIGNDIRIAVDLSQYLVTGDRTSSENRKVYDTTTGEFIQFELGTSPISIRSIDAYLISNGRGYNLCTSGIPSWHVRPYNGFGLHPNFKEIYRKVCFDRVGKYKAQVYATSKQNTVEVIFPAEDQKQLGVYKLIVVAKVYAPGYNRSNLKTITVDMSDVFELVSTSEEGIDTGIHINAGIIQDILPSEEDIPKYTYEDKYLSDAEFNEDENVINLQMNDGEHFSVDLDNRLGWYYAD